MSYEFLTRGDSQFKCLRIMLSNNNVTFTNFTDQSSANIAVEMRRGTTRISLSIPPSDFFSNTSKTEEKLMIIASCIFNIESSCKEEMISMISESYKEVKNREIAEAERKERYPRRRS